MLKKRMYGCGLAFMQWAIRKGYSPDGFLVGEDKLLTAHIANGRGRRKTLWEIVRSNKMRLYWEYAGKEWSGYILLVLEYDGFWGRFRGNTIIKRTGKRALFPVL